MIRWRHASPVPYLPDGHLEIELPDLPSGRGPAGGVSWACRQCRDGVAGSAARREGPQQRAARVVERLAGHPLRGLRRPQEKWWRERQREIHLAKAESVLRATEGRFESQVARLARLVADGSTG